MVKAEIKDLQNLRCLLLIMETTTGLKVNWSKSMLSPVGNIHNMESLVAVLDCEVKVLPITYLGLPLGAKTSSSVIWNPIIERLNKKLSSWTDQYLSKGGRLILVKNVLASMPIYLLSLYQAPKMVTNQIERIMRDFLWGSSRDKRKIHWVNWKDICKPMVNGGLGIRSVANINRALVNKWIWRFGVENNASWRRLVAAKNGEAMHGWTSGYPEGTMGCGVWRNIVKGINGFLPCVWFKINNGARVHFWHDPWCDREKLATLSILLQPRGKQMGYGERPYGENKSIMFLEWNIHPRRHFDNWEIEEMG